MVESARPRIAAPFDMPRRISEALPGGRSVRAAGVAAAALLAFWLIFKLAILGATNAYPAVVLAFLAMTLVPGLFVQRILLASEDSDAVERFVFSLPFGIAVAAPPALLAIALDLDLNAFLWLHIVFAAAVCGASTLFATPEREPAEPEGWSAQAIALVALIAIGVGGIVTSPVWAAEDVSRDFDDWRYMAYVNSYLHEDHLDPLGPIGIGEQVEPRIANNAWLVMQAGVASAADASAEEVLISYLGPVLTVFALAASYVLARGLFRSRAIALLAVAFTLGYALIDGSPHEGFGRNILVRMSQDKMVTTFIFLPLFLLLMNRFLEKPDWRTYVAFTVLSLTCYAVHPQALFFLAIILAGLAVVRCPLSMSLRPLGPLVILGAPVLAAALAQFFTWQLVGTRESLFAPGQTWREEFRIVHLAGDMIVGNFHLILHPLLLASIVIAPLLFWRARSSVAHQVLLVATVGWLPWLFVPPLTTVSAKLVSSTFVIREPWIAPVGIVLALAVVEVQRALARQSWAASLTRIRALSVGGVVLAPVAAVALVLSAALVVQETYVRADGGAFYEWTSGEAIVPWADESIFLGGNDRLFGREYRRGHREDALFAALEHDVPEGSFVMVPRRAGIFLPGVVANVTPVYSAAPPAVPIPPLFTNLYYTGTLQGADLAAALRAIDVDYVAVEDGSLAHESMLAVPGAMRLADAGQYELFVLEGTP